MTMMNEPDDADAGNGDSLSNDVAAELERHNTEMANIMAEHGMAAPDEEDDSGD
jgi:hypothetical protein